MLEGDFDFLSTYHTIGSYFCTLVCSFTMEANRTQLLFCGFISPSFIFYCGIVNLYGKDDMTFSKTLFLIVQDGFQLSA